MFNELVLVHQKASERALTPALSGASALETLSANPHWFYLPTCLRKIAVGPAAQLDRSLIDTNQFDIFEGAQAYRFILEVICGLKSPLIGETEIFGQFKTAAAQFESTAHIGSAPLRKFLRALNEDAKKVRDLHLKDLGSQSYGSLVRKELKGIKKVHFIGAGQLTKDILPWLVKDGTEVHIHARDVKRAAKALPAFANIQIHSLDSKFEAGEVALIVAAPVEAEWLNAWAAERNFKFKVIMDLRGDSHLDRLSIPTAKTVLLNELFERISENQNILQERKDRALKEIHQAVVVREQHVEYRPFGWEDVCA